MAIVIRAKGSYGNIEKAFEDSQLVEALDYADDLNKSGYKVEVENLKGITLKELGETLLQGIKPNHETDLKLN